MRFSLVSAMTTLLACGLTLEQAVPMVTCDPARMLRLEGSSARSPRACADVSVLHDERGQWVCGEDENTQVRATRLLRPAFCLRAGEGAGAATPQRCVLAEAVEVGAYATMERKI